MKNVTPRQRGLSLIELMIVISVIGILAAIVVPRYSNAKDMAMSGSLAAQISTLKKALEVYKAEHNDSYPTTAQLITIKGGKHGRFGEKQTNKIYRDIFKFLRRHRIIN